MISKCIKELHIRDLFELIRVKPFDRECAERIIENIDDVNEVFIGRYDCPSLFLGDAVAYNNLGAVQFFLEHGADPNAIPENTEAACPMWLTTLPGPPDEIEERIEIVKLLLKYGGNPNLVIDGQSIVEELEEEMCEWVVDSDLEYMHRVLKLMKQHNAEGNRMAKEMMWRYCVVGNIVKSRIDENGVLRYGTAAFAGGKKVYLCGRLWDGTRNSISVIGLSRGKQFQVVDTPCSAIENIRCQRTYKPSVLRLMNDWEFTECWWGNTPTDKNDAEAFSAWWNTRKKENKM